MRAVWNNAVLADSNNTKIVEGTHYFPSGSVKMEYLRKNGRTYTCPWKGVCEYYDVVVDGEINKDAAWAYEMPNEIVKEITGHFAFWKGVKMMP
ncbi:DUF427 domain-containing protein [Candidatus Uhrbacteria bacterium]|nr:DUF427 domain-containing protein [Candidatus Uhrbacteria bacterium]